ncbi:MAG: hypothetical protein ACK41E_06895 [Deinococcales bacterium]
MMEISSKTQQLVTMLLDHEVFSTTALDHILEQYNAVGGRFADFLLDTKLLGEGDLLRMYANVGFGLANLEMLENIPQQVTQQLSANLSYLHKAIPFREHGNQLDVAFLEPPEANTLQTMKGFAGREVRVFLAGREILTWAIAKHYPELLQTPASKEMLFDPLEDRIGQRLVRSGHLTKAQLQEALFERTPGKAGRTGEVLLRMGYVSEDDVYRALAEQVQLPFVQLPKAFEIPREVLVLLSQSEARRFQCVPFAESEMEIRMLTCEPHSIDEVQKLFDRRIVWSVTTPSNLKNLVSKLVDHFHPVFNIMIAQGLLRFEQRAQIHARVLRGVELDVAILEAGIAPEDLQQAKAVLSQVQLIPVVGAWEGKIDLVEPLIEMPNSNTQQKQQELDAFVRKIVREELERFRASILSELQQT